MSIIKIIKINRDVSGSDKCYNKICSRIERSKGHVTLEVK